MQTESPAKSGAAAKTQPFHVHGAHGLLVTSLPVTTILSGKPGATLQAVSFSFHPFSLLGMCSVEASARNEGGSVLGPTAIILEPARDLAEQVGALSQLACSPQENWSLAENPWLQSAFFLNSGPLQGSLAWPT